MAENLKPCPFCGGGVVRWRAKSEELAIDLGYRFFCENNCCMQVRFYKTEGEAIEAWNRRAPDPVHLDAGVMAPYIQEKELEGIRAFEEHLKRRGLL